MNLIIDIIGYVGMVLVLSSFLCKDFRNARKVNICGAILSGISAWLGFGMLGFSTCIPPALLNTLLVIINSCMLIRRK